MNDAAKIEIEVNLKEDDLNKAYIVLFSRPVRIITIIGASFLGLLLLRIGISIVYEDTYSSVLIRAFVIILMVFLSVIYGLHNNIGIARKVYKSNQEFQSTITYDFSPDGLGLKTENSYAKYAWNTFYSYRENKDTLLIYISVNTFWVIPKRIFDADDNNLHILEEYLKEIPVQKEKLSAKRKLKYIMIIAIFAIIYFLHYYIMNIYDGVELGYKAYDILKEFAYYE